MTILERVSDLPELDAAEQRVLGGLLEKEVTVPASYPMTVAAVRTACNQTSSREPVVEYDERRVHDTLRALKAKDLVAVTWADTGRRTMKYVQTLSVRLDLADDERALLTILLLRGAQAPGALKTRTERLHPFADREEVAACLTRMAAAEPPLVRELPRRAREQDHRWVHLLGPVGEGPTPEPPAGEDRDSVLADGAAARDAKVVASYAAVAAPYAEAFQDELDGLPFERWLLDRVADGPGPVVEVGCGPGHVTAYLAARGVEASGIDLTPEMIEQARRRYPDGHYTVGDLRRLIRPTSAPGWGAVVAWYSLTHLAPAELAEALAALVRPLDSGGTLVLALHAGTGVRTLQSWFERDIDLDFVLHDRADVVRSVEESGLVDVEWFHRGSLAARGETTERLYFLARKP